MSIPEWGSVCHSTAFTMAWQHPDMPQQLLLYDPDGQLEYVLTLGPPRRRRSKRDRRVDGRSSSCTAHTTLLDALVTNPDLPLTPRAADLLERARLALAAARARPPRTSPPTAVPTRTSVTPEPSSPAGSVPAIRPAAAPPAPAPRAAPTSTTPSPSTTADSPPPTTSAHSADATTCSRSTLRSGWTVTQPSPGTFVWIAPTGARHVVTPEPYDELPDPVPPRCGPFSLPADIGRTPRPTEPFAARRTRDGRLTEAARTAADQVADNAAKHEENPRAAMTTIPTSDLPAVRRACLLRLCEQVIKRAS